MKVQDLRNALIVIFNQSFNNLHTDFNNRIITKGVAFFPCGNGLLDENENEILEDGILVLGKDFGGVDYFNAIKENGELSRITCRNLKAVVNDLAHHVFLSNVFMGLRKEEYSNMEAFPEILNVAYLSLCKEFLKYQIEQLKPRLIITLGYTPNEFLLCNIELKNEKVLNIPHPSMWHFNLKNSGLEKEDIKRLISNAYN